jgi:polynucleotide 5'-kinase involved in rRNA processing
VDPRDVSFERTLWNRGESVRARAFAAALDCPVLEGWRTNEEALVVDNGFPHLVEEAREEFGLRELHVVHANHFTDLLVGLETPDAEGGRFVGLGVTRGVDWKTGRVKLWTRAKRGSFEALRPGAIRLGERFHELEHVRIP